MTSKCLLNLQSRGVRNIWVYFRPPYMYHLSFFGGHIGSSMVQVTFILSHLKVHLMQTFLLLFFKSIARKLRQPILIDLLLIKKINNWM